MSLENVWPTAGETVGKGQDNSFPSHCNDAAEICQGAVEAALRALKAFSYESRASKHELCRVLSLSSPRALQEIIARERQTAPICSSASGGYWLGDPDSVKGRAEISSTAATMEKRAVETFQTARALRRWTKVPLGQLEIQGGGGNGES